MKFFSLLALSSVFVGTAFAQAIPIERIHGPLAPGPKNGEGVGVGHGVSSSSSLGGPFNGLSIGQNVGANRFYNAGFTGTRAIASSIEAGLAWNSHETLTHVNTLLFSNDPSLAGSSIGQFDRHATWVAQALAGRGANEYQRGIAFGSTLWSGGIATSYGTPAFSTSFGWSNGNAFISPYATSMLTGVNGQTADVINSSWGNTSPNNFNVFAVSLDGMVRQSGKTLVFSAGNQGSGANTIGSPANGHNAIVVGALGPDTGGYQTITGFSSRSPSDYNGPDGLTAAARARVDITAPGQNMTLAFYGGATGGNNGGTDTSGGATNFYSFNTAGTSFAAPTVAGGAALIVDAGKALFGGGNSVDGRVVKSIIQTSAQKPAGWSNGQALISGVITTNQSLDFAYGAGRLDLDKGFDVYTTGTTDVAGLGGGSVSNLGWDFGEVTQGGFSDYYISPELLGGSTLTTTLNWFANSNYGGVSAGGTITTSADSFTNLGLEVWATAGAVPTTKIAESTSLFLTTQHLNFALPGSGSYMLRVKWLGERYDFVNNNSERFALSWNGTANPVPEPSLMIGMGVGIASLLRRRRKTNA